MKKLLVICIAVIMTLSLAACKQDVATTTAGTTTSSTTAVDTTSDTGGSANTGETYTIRMATGYPDVGFFGETPRLWMEEIEKVTDNQIVFEYYPAAQLMPIDQEIPAILDKRIEAQHSITSLLSAYVPEIGIFEMPLLFGPDDVYMFNLRKYYDTPEFKEYAVAESNKKGIYTFFAMSDTARCIIATKVPIKEFGDVKGLKIRSPAGKWNLLAATALGFSATTITGAELPTALMQGTVDGVLTGILYLTDNKLPSYNFLGCPIDYTHSAINISTEFLATLPQDIQDKMHSIEVAFTDRRYTDACNDIGSRFENLAEIGYKVNKMTDEDFKKGQELCKPIWEQFKKENANGDKLVDAALAIVNAPTDYDAINGVTESPYVKLDPANSN